MRLLHYIDLSVVGGVEHQFAQFLHYTWNKMGVRHGVIASGSKTHPQFRSDILRDADFLALEKSKWGIKLPKWPRNLRSLHQQSMIRRARPDVTLLWNKGLGKADIVRQFGPERCIFWDRSASWGRGPVGGESAFLPEVRAVIANSRASQRMLQLRWHYRGDIAVCRNALRPNMRPSNPTAKPYPRNRPVKIGTATRLESQKGVNLAVYTLRELRQKDFDAELHIAGTGTEADTLKTLTRQLGLDNYVHFHGHVLDMRNFYQSIDCLLHLPITEPLAGIWVEALAYGCPVITTNIDGAPEIVDDYRTGRLIVPRLSITEYCKLGGHDHGLPPYVYDPVTDDIMEPCAAAPDDAATAIAALFGDEQAYERASAQGMQEVLDNFAYPDHVETVMATISRFVETGSIRNLATAAS